MSVAAVVLLTFFVAATMFTPAGRRSQEGGEEKRNRHETLHENINNHISMKGKIKTKEKEKKKLMRRVVMLSWR